MLLQLNITNFAIINELDLSLSEGFHTLSGETGAGKSIIINAINLIRGGRSSSDLIRTGCESSTVEALFSVPQNAVLTEIFSDLDIPFDGEVLIRRSISREGRNKVFINGALATLQMLSRLAPLLISISGQHEHQLLLKPDNHLYLLDDFSGLDTERSRFQDLFRCYQSLNQKIKTQEKALQEHAQRRELAAFQAAEIEQANPSPGEDEALAEEKTRLQHAEALLTLASEGYHALYERDNSVISDVSRTIRSLSRGAEMDPNLTPLRDALSEVEAKLEDIALSLRDFQQTVHLDPRQLEQVMERLEMLNRLKRKYGGTLEDLLKFRDELAARMQDMDESQDHLEDLKKERDALLSDMTNRAKELSKRRKAGALKFETAVKRELEQLQMKGTRFNVHFEPIPDNQENGDTRESTGLDVNGLDKVEFMISPNVGEALRPLAKIASGGELSRIMLALKTILARTGSVETLIFDEVDAGISGSTAEVVGEKLASLAAYHQILCITHLPQIASKGHTHFLATKHVTDGRTETAIRVLDNHARVKEIARLLGGREITPQGMALAEEMLASDG